MGSMRVPTQHLGEAAEDLAAAFLRLSGFEIVDRNVRAGGGEIDLVARRGAWLHLIEVRYRRTARFGHPVETLRGRKARALARAARAYVARLGAGGSCWRFDAVSVVFETDNSAQVRLFPGILRM
jgi:putative endonuclease